MDASKPTYLTDQLERLQKLRVDGVISDDEFQKLKSRLLEKELGASPDAQSTKEIGTSEHDNKEQTPTDTALVEEVSDNSTPQANDAEPDYVYRVRDVGTILFSLIVMAVPAAIGANILFSPDASNPNSSQNWATVAFAIAILAFLRLKTIWGGIAFSSRQNTIEFPGGSVSFNSVLDVLKPSFLLQFFVRYRVNMSGIRSIQSGSHIKLTSPINILRALTKKGSTYTPYLQLVGNFGGAKINFASEGKRDEAYQHIRIKNRMGLPIFQT
jgi:hypothetical protein